MRTLLSCLALAMFAGIIGCGEPATDTEKPAETPAETGSDETAKTDLTGEMQNVSLNVPAMT